MKCAMCGKVLGENEVFFGEMGTEYASLPLCKKCYLKHLRKLLYMLQLHENINDENIENYSPPEKIDYTIHL